MTGRDPRPEKTRDYRRSPHGLGRRCTAKGHRWSRMTSGLSNRTYRCTKQAGHDQGPLSMSALGSRLHDFGRNVR